MVLGPKDCPLFHCWRLRLWKVSFRVHRFLRRAWNKPLRKCPHCAALFREPMVMDADELCPICLHMLPERPRQTPKAKNVGKKNPPRMNTGATKTGRKRRRRLAVLLARDGDRCWLCGRRLGGDITEDHYIPRSKGGTNALTNLRLAHRRCNSDRGDADPHQEA